MIQVELKSLNDELFSSIFYESIPVDGSDWQKQAIANFSFLVILIILEFCQLKYSYLNNNLVINKKTKLELYI